MLITGAAGDLGRAMVTGLLTRGCRVAVMDADPAPFAHSLLRCHTVLADPRRLLQLPKNPSQTARFE